MPFDDSSMSETAWPDSIQGSQNPDAQSGYYPPDGGPASALNPFGQKWNFRGRGVADPNPVGPPMAWGSTPDQTPPIDKTTGQPTQSPSTTPSSGFDLGGMFNSLQTTTVLGIPLLYIVIAGVVYFFFIKKGR